MMDWSLFNSGICVAVLFLALFAACVVGAVAHEVDPQDLVARMPAPDPFRPTIPHPLASMVPPRGARWPMLLPSSGLYCPDCIAEETARTAPGWRIEPVGQPLLCDAHYWETKRVVERATQRGFAAAFSSGDDGTGGDTGGDGDTAPTLIGLHPAILDAACEAMQRDPGYWRD